MKKNVLKILLDIVMTAILVLMYNSHAISLAFHETAGLFLFGLFIIHCLFNKKWVASITAKFFSKSLAPRVRFGYILDLLLLISFVLIIISGIFTSQVLFAPVTQVKDSPWRSVHHFFAALSIILVGIHIGLHWNFVTGMFKKAIRIPYKLAKFLSMSLLLIVLGFGSYSMAASGFTGWLAEPFLLVNESTSDSETDSTKIEDKASWDGSVNDDKPGESSTMAEENTAETDVKEADDTNDQTGKSGEDKGGTTEEATEPVGSGETGGDASAHPAGEKKSEEGSPIVIAGTVATYLSILGIFSAITYYIDKFLKNRKRAGGKTS